MILFVDYVGFDTNHINGFVVCSLLVVNVIFGYSNKRLKELCHSILSYFGHIQNYL